MRNYSEACERNKDAILRCLQQCLHGSRLVLEIGSGSGQHAVYFANALDQLVWQPSDLRSNLPALADNLRDYAPSNVEMPLELDVNQPQWVLPAQPDAVFTANTLHIMDEGSVEKLIKGVGQILPKDGRLCVYGPFRYGGRYTSISNAQFDTWLKRRNAQSGIRDFETINGWAGEVDLEIEKDHSMPANNQFLVWRKRG